MAQLRLLVVSVAGLIKVSEAKIAATHTNRGVTCGKDVITVSVFCELTAV